MSPKQVFTALERERTAGRLAASVSSAPVRCQACSRRPDYLARLDRDGSCRVGRSVNGEFLACEVDAH